MATVGSHEAKTHLPALLERVRQGEKITITRRGVPIAMLVPVGPPETTDLEAVLKQLRRFRCGRQLGGLSVREMIEEGAGFDSGCA